jgi:ABC-type nitrate/sulfonate/bicarbonate transport system substrate-binding protein
MDAMNRFRIVLLALTFVLGALPAAAQTRDKITVAFPTVDPTAEVLYAFDLGLFEKAGLDVTLQPLSNGGAIAAGVASGTIDIGIGNVIAIETAHSKGLPLTVIAPAALNLNSAPSNVLIVKKDSPLRTAHDLNGLVIATNPLRGIGDLLTSAWIDKNGGDSTTIKYIEIPFPDAEGVVVQGRASASLSVEPFITQAKGDTRVFANTFGVLGDGYLITAYFAAAPWAAAHPSVVAKFAAVIHDTAIWANANPAKSAEILAKYSHLDVAVVNQTIRARYATTLTPGQLQPTIDTAAHYKYIDSAFPAKDIIYQAK